MKKQEIREDFIQHRNLLSQAEYTDLCTRLFERFKQIDLAGINCMHLFMLIHKRKEPDTTLIRDWLLANHPQLKLVYPKTNFADYTMESFIHDKDLQIEINAFGISEPIIGNQVEPQEIDMILVPLLAFDRQGYRVGYGKGFYDRFMAQCKPSCQFIGLSLFKPVDHIDDTDQYDIKMHQCLTPDKIWQF